MALKLLRSSFTRLLRLGYILIFQLHEMLSPVAYAGFSKGGQEISENLRVMKNRMKIFQPKTKSVFLPNLGENQKKKGLHSNLVRFLAQN